MPMQFQQFFIFLLFYFYFSVIINRSSFLHFLTFVTIHCVPSRPQTEICEAYIHRGVVFGSSEEAEEVF